MRYFLISVIVCLCLSTNAIAANDPSSPSEVQAATKADSVEANASAPASHPTETQLRRAYFLKQLSQSLETIKPDSQIMLVWFTADDCPACNVWARGFKQNTSQREFARSDIAKTIQMSMVRKQSLNKDYVDRDFGKDVEFVKAARFKSGRVAGLRAYPWFVVYVDEVPVSESSQWDKDTLPALEKLAAKRLALRP
jgi:thioredoxin-related protein